MLLVSVIVPDSGESFPASRLRRVDFPVPFFAIRATFCPSKMVNEIFLNRINSPHLFERFSACKYGFIFKILVKIENELNLGLHLEKTGKLKVVNEKAGQHRLFARLFNSLI
jgi:hypothetical protein